MASLKDLIVMGPARFLDKIYGNLEGNAATATTLSSTLALNKGGTGATTKTGAKTNLGITYGTTLPTSGMSEGDIFFKIG